MTREESEPKLSACCGAPFIENSEMCYPHDGIVGQCSKCMEFSEEQEKARRGCKICNGGLK